MASRDRNTHQTIATLLTLSNPSHHHDVQCNCPALSCPFSAPQATPGPALDSSRGAWPDYITLHGITLHYIILYYTSNHFYNSIPSASFMRWSPAGHQAKPSQADRPSIIEPHRRKTRDGHLAPIKAQQTQRESACRPPQSAEQRRRRSHHHSARHAGAGERAPDHAQDVCHFARKGETRRRGKKN